MKTKVSEAVDWWLIASIFTLLLVFFFFKYSDRLEKRKCFIQELRKELEKYRRQEQNKRNHSKYVLEEMSTTQGNTVFGSSSCLQAWQVYNAGHMTGIP